MKILKLSMFIFSILLLLNCNSKPYNVPILIADREAPLGNITLKVYKDSSFEFISSGIREKEIFLGIVKKSKDTLYFNYAEKTTKAGKIAIINNGFINFIGGEYQESLKIKVNEFDELKS